MTLTADLLNALNALNRSEGKLKDLSGLEIGNWDDYLDAFDAVKEKMNQLEEERDAMLMIVCYLVKHGQTALHVAAKTKNQTDIVKCLVDNEVDPNATDNKGNTALHFAAEYNRVEAAEYLIGKVTDKNATNNAGDTALHLAAMNGHFNIAKYLENLDSH